MPKSKIKKSCLKLSQATVKLILASTFISIDPSSCSADSKMGFAVYTKQKLIKSGIFNIDHKLHIFERLRLIRVEILKLVAEFKPSVLVIEKLRGRVHTYLRWSAVTPIVVTDLPVVEISPVTWKKYIDKNYCKSDEVDAIMIGVGVINEIKAPK